MEYLHSQSKVWDGYVTGQVTVHQKPGFPENRMTVSLVESVATIFKQVILLSTGGLEGRSKSRWIPSESLWRRSSVENVKVTHWFSKSQHICCLEQAKQGNGRFPSVFSVCCSVSCGCLCHTWQICSDPKPHATVSFLLCCTRGKAQTIHQDSYQSSAAILQALLFLIPNFCLFWGILTVYLNKGHRSPQEERHI